MSSLPPPREGAGEGGRLRAYEGARRGEASPVHALTLAFRPPELGENHCCWSPQSAVRR